MTGDRPKQRAQNATAPTPAYIGRSSSPIRTSEKETPQRERERERRRKLGHAFYVTQTLGRIFSTHLLKFHYHPPEVYSYLFDNITVAFASSFLLETSCESSLSRTLSWTREHLFLVGLRKRRAVRDHKQIQIEGSVRNRWQTT